MLQKVCCMRLETAGKVIGWLGVVCSLILIILLSIGISAQNSRSTIASYETDEIDSGLHNKTEPIIIGSSIYLVLLVLNFISSGLLVLGTIKERHLMLLPWLIISVISVVGNILKFILKMSNKQSEDESLAVDVIAFIIQSVLSVYIFYGIYSLYKQIQLTRSQKNPLAHRQP